MDFDFNDSKLKSNLPFQAFDLDRIDKDDDGLLDLEAFNAKFKYLFPKVSTNYSTIKSQSMSYYNLPNNLIKSKKSIISGITPSNYNPNLSTFSLRLYFERVLNELPKSKLKKIMIDIANLNVGDYNLLSMTKTFKTSYNKPKLIELVIQMILHLIKS